MKAIKITTNDIIEVIDIGEPIRECIKSAVGGYPEVVNPSRLYSMFKDVPDYDSLCMVVNADGRDVNFRLNAAANFLYQYAGIYGDILIIENKFKDFGYEFAGLSEEQESTILSEFRRIFSFLKVK